MGSAPKQPLNARAGISISQVFAGTVEIVHPEGDSAACVGLQENPQCRARHSLMSAAFCAIEAAKILRTLRKFLGHRGLKDLRSGSL